MKPTDKLFKMYNMPDIIMGSQLNLRRNLIGYFFCKSAGTKELLEVRSSLMEVALKLDCFQKRPTIMLDRVDHHVARSYGERRFISQEDWKENRGRAIIIGRGNKVILVINDEDHASIFLNSQDSDLMDSWDMLSEIDDQLEKELGFSFGPQFGYQCAKIGNTGTGLCCTFFLHIPAILIESMEGDLEEIMQMYDINIANNFDIPRAHSSFIRIENNQKIGISEEEIILRMENAAIQIAEIEKVARNRILEREPVIIEDQIVRAKAILSNAKLINFVEAEKHLSSIRLGLEIGFVRGIGISDVNATLDIITPGMLLGGKMSESVESQKYRSSIIKRLIADKIELIGIN